MKIYLHAYLQRNFGDDLFLHILVKRYPKHEFYAITTDKTYKKQYSNLHVLSQNLFVRAFRKLELESFLANQCHLVVTLGGSMFIETPKNRKKSYYLGKNPHYILGINFGPYQTKEYFNNVKDHFSKAKDICFRENYSYELFDEISHVRKASDIVFSLSTDNITVKDDNLVIISVISCENKISKEYQSIYYEKIIQIIQFFQAQEYNIVLMSFCEWEGDEEAVMDILHFLQDTTHLQTYFYKGDIEETLGLFAKAKIIIGSRFHANILGLLFNKVIIPIAYSDKTINVLDDLGFKSLKIDIKNIHQFSIDQLTEDVLNYHLDVTEAITDADNHFFKLDGILK